jgi:hypothetical protein
MPYENYFSLGHKHLTQKMWKKKGSFSDVFKGVEEQLFCLKFNLEFGHLSYREIAFGKIFQSGLYTSCSGK